jgi:hypothetical protein
VGEPKKEGKKQEKWNIHPPLILTHNIINKHKNEYFEEFLQNGKIKEGQNVIKILHTGPNKFGVTHNLPGR